MRSLIITTSILFIGFSGRSQSIEVIEENSKDNIQLLNSIGAVYEFSEAEFALKLIERSLITTTHVRGLEGDVVIQQLYLSVRKLVDDKTLTKTYWVDGNYHNPREYTFDFQNQILSFNHGSVEYANIEKLKVSVDGITRID